MKVSQELPRVEYKKILYVTDLSDTGRFAFPHAASIANRYKAEFTVFHVVETEEFEKYLVGYISEDLWDQIKTRNLQEARDILISRKRDDTAIKDAIDHFCQGALAEGDKQPYVTYEVVVKIGDPVEEIIEQAHGGNYDLVVIGNHGRRVTTDILMGSTAWRVLHRCKIPVMVVRLPTEQD
ncbi:MAG: universal stress protein [Gammaproteobacteria bacterium]|jgi:nucleotide-binding universal stress UspA family protein|nr:universal stress protein [Gammaproteobacteria bacterium]